MRGIFWLVLLSILLMLSVAGELRFLFGLKSNIQTSLQEGRAKRGVLYVWIHGYTPKEAHLKGVSQSLAPFGDVLTVNFPASLTSDADPQAICEQISEAIRRHASSKDYSRIVLVAHSVGALLARRTLLVGLAQDEAWATLTKRVVLLAGTNRGWDSQGPKPMDLSWFHRFAWRVGEWGARLTGWGTFILQFQAGTPFVSNLRLEWMRYVRSPESKHPVEVVQLLGDIDGVVSQQDSADLRVMASAQYAHLRVRGTGHGDIIDFTDRALGSYRKEKLILAATEEAFSVVSQQSEEQPYTTEDDVRTIVFVLHGIRDLARWSSVFEAELRMRVNAGVRIVSPRYGYFGMGPFLLPAVRERHVRWFMDQYTETLARYPNVEAKEIKFFGHSNGTYLLADALVRYQSMSIDRVVFAGSVVPRSYDWSEVLNRRQVSQVRNYVGTSDWVVAWFPRIFEVFPVSLLRNRLGSAGYEGFDAGSGCDPELSATPRQIANICYVQGQHSAFKGRVQEIVSFLVDTVPSPALEEERSSVAQVALSRAVMWLVWVLLIGVVIYLGVRVVSAAPSPIWIALVLYILLVIRTLQVI